MNNKSNPSKANKGGVKSFFKQRGTKRGAVSVLLTVLVLAALVLINVVLAAVTDKHPLYIDVTENSSYQLQQETKDYLKEISEPVIIYVLQKETDFESGDSNNYKYRVQANKLLHAIENSSDKVELHYVDITAEPTFTSDYPQVAPRFPEPSGWMSTGTTSCTGAAAWTPRPTASPTTAAPTTMWS